MSKLFDKKQPKPHLAKVSNALLLAGLFITLLLLQSAVWANRAFFSTQTFSDTVTTSLTSQSSRDAIAGDIVGQTLKDRPIVKRIIGNRLTSGISSMLGSDLAEGSIRTVSERMQMYLTSNAQQSVEIDMTGIKNIVQLVSTIAGSSEDQSVKADQLPDKITLVDAEKIPSFYSYGKILLYLSPISFAIGLGCAIAYIRKNKRGYRRIYMVLATIAASTFTAIAMGPLFKPPVLDIAKTIYGRQVMSNIYDAFLQLFTNQLLVTLYVVAVAAAVTYYVQNHRKIIAFVRKK